MNGPIQSLTSSIKAVGILFILAGIGIFAIGFVVPRLIGVILALIFLAGGALRIVYAFLSRPAVGFWLKLSTGLLFGTAGLVLLSGIFRQYVSVSLILGTVLMVEALLELVLALKLPPGSLRRWVLISSGVAFGLGILFSLNSGLGTAWLLGLVAGLSLTTPGVWLIVLAQGLRHTSPNAPNTRPRRWR